MAAQERLSRAEVRSESTQREMVMHKTNEARLLQEKESMLRQKSSQDMLLANLQAIQVRHHVYL